MDHPEPASLKLIALCGSRALLFLVGASALVASEFADLDRMVPVPADQQIPIIDFVRPVLFADVQLNHAGTQIGAGQTLMIIREE